MRTNEEIADKFNNSGFKTENEMRRAMNKIEIELLFDIRNMLKELFEDKIIEKTGKIQKEVKEVKKEIEEAKLSPTFEEELVALRKPQ